MSEVNRRYGGIPAELLQHADVMALLVPALRADITALDRHPVRAAAQRLACPVTAIGGDADAMTPAEHLEAWRSLTQGAFSSKLYRGGHFYLDARRSEVLRDITAALRVAQPAGR
ncbi:hypothetical protein FSC37_09710 [Piscinibacter aquaticus]|uniref:Thioesterase domain-containing protein n=1 Tax=Piscinibacter aquaticus TaxID=392597 RepID=A0A5C6U2C6_9BURK|nr:hypothetical protein FSC37_09710 [Piscinibacter aquaticus]